MRRSRAFQLLVRAAHRGYAAMRHASAVDLAAASPTGTVASMRGHRTAAVATYRRDGTPVVTPVWFGQDGDRVYFRAERGSGKAKRLANDGRVLLAPCTFRGRPLAAPYAATARILRGDEAAHAERVIQGAFGPGRAVYERTFTQPDGIYVEVVP